MCRLELSQMGFMLGCLRVQRGLPLALQDQQRAMSTLNRQASQQEDSVAVDMTQTECWI